MDEEDNEVDVVLGAVAVGGGVILAIEFVVIILLLFLLLPIVGAWILK